MILPEDHRRVVETHKTLCPRCMVPYGYGSCDHRPRFDQEAAIADLVRRHGSDGARLKLLLTVERISREEEHKQRVRNVQHALRYRDEARRGA